MTNTFRNEDFLDLNTFRNVFIILNQQQQGQKGNSKRTGRNSKRTGRNSKRKGRVGAGGADRVLAMQQDDAEIPKSIASVGPSQGVQSSDVQSSQMPSNFKIRGNGRAKNPQYFKATKRNRRFDRANNWNSSWNANRMGHGRCRLLLTLRTKDQAWYQAKLDASNQEKDTLKQQLQQKDQELAQQEQKEEKLQRDNKQLIERLEKEAEDEEDEQLKKQYEGTEPRTIIDKDGNPITNPNYTGPNDSTEKPQPGTPAPTSEPEKEDEGMPWWGVMLIVLGSVIVVGGIVQVIVILRKPKPVFTRYQTDAPGQETQTIDRQDCQVDTL